MAKEDHPWRWEGEVEARLKQAQDRPTPGYVEPPLSESEKDPGYQLRRHVQNAQELAQKAAEEAKVDRLRKLRKHGK
jgi:hypothetical protein